MTHSMVRTSSSRVASPVSPPTPLIPLVVVAILALLGAAPSGQAADDPSGLEVRDAWIRLPPPLANAAGYLRIESTSASALRIVGVESDVAARTEIHRSWIEGGVARMRRVDSLEVPAGGELVLEPHGFHVMLIRPEPLTEGQRVELRFEIEGKGTLTVAAEVRRSPPEAAEPGS